MNLFEINFGALLIRYYLMMTAVILGVLTGNSWLAILALPLFLLSIMGVKFLNKKTVTQKQSEIIIIDDLPNVHRKAS